MTADETRHLPPRRESFLAHYSRQSKLAFTGVVLLGLLSGLYLVDYALSTPSTEATQHKTKVHSADRNRKGTSRATPHDGVKTADTSDDAAEIDDSTPVTMAPAPDPDLTETTPSGDLPRISDDGRMPWQVYARPFRKGSKTPRLAIIISDLGLSRGITGTAIARLPGTITLAFDVQSQAIGAWCARARQEGHETLLSVPMEPFDYPRSDPGARTLLTSLDNTDNLERLNWALRQCNGYVGITTSSGSRFTTDTTRLKPIIDALQQRGLMIVDPHLAPHSAVTDIASQSRVAVATASARVDDDLSPEAIDSALAQMEQTARLNGHAVGILPPLPLVIDRVEAWSKKLAERGIALAPVSAVVQ